MILTLILLCSPIVALTAADAQYSRELTPDEFVNFSQENGIRVLYFYRHADLAKGLGRLTYDQSKVAVGGERGAGWEKSEVSVSDRLLNFFKAYEGSAEILDSYGAKLGKVACMEEYPSSVDQFCGLINIGYYVQCYRDGKLAVEWPLENMFDVDSIVSNILDIVLSHEIPRIETKQCRRDQEMEARGKKNLLVGYFRKVGTYEHRNFMEVGHKNIDTVDFAATDSLRAVSDLPWFDPFDDAAIWVFFCKEAQGNNLCQVVKHMGAKCQDELRNLVSILDLPAIHDVPSDGDMDPYKGKEIHRIVAFYDSQNEDYVKGIAVEASSRLRGFLGILLINVDETDAKSYGYNPDLKTPSMYLQVRGSDEKVYKPGDKVNYEFVSEQLGHLHPGLEEFMRDDYVQGYTRALDDYDDRSFEPHVEKEDSPLASEEWRLRWLEPLEAMEKKNLPALNDVQLADTKINTELTIVLFYIYLDQRSTAVYRSFLEAANILAVEALDKPVLNTMECFDWSHVCRAEDMFTYPSIRIYRSSGDWVLYDGVFSTEAFVSLARLYTAQAPHILTSAGEAKQFMDGQLPPDMVSFTDTAVLGLFDKEQTTEIASFKEAADKAQGKLLYAIATGDLAKQLATEYNTQTPNVVINKRNDKYQPITITSELCPVAIANAAAPIFPELTASTFVRYLEMNKPIVVLFTNKKESPLHDTLADLVKQNRFPGLILVWMNAEKVGSPGARILLDYDSKASLPTLVLTDRQKGTVHVKTEITSDGISQWIQAVLGGLIPRKKGMNSHVWKARNPGYNFLKFVDDVEALEGVERPPLPDKQEQFRQDLLQLGLDPDRRPGARHTEL